MLARYRFVPPAGLIVLLLVAPGGEGRLDAAVSAWPPADWEADFEAARARARAVGRPVFVYFDAGWCSWCQQYTRDTLDKPSVRRALEREFVPVVVDFDARPDLVQRYGGKGLPFTVILAPDGTILNRFVGVMTPADLLDLLRATRGGGGRPRPSSMPPAAVSEPVRVVALDRAGFERFRAAWLERLEELYDPERGTLAGRFETGATLKRPSPMTWIYLSERGLWPFERIRRAARAERERLWDRLDGGFFNFLDPGRADYLETSKLLEANAWLVAWQAVVGESDPPARVLARAGWFYLREVLWDEVHGGFYQAQVADNVYYGLAPRVRLRRPPPPVLRLKRADTNAQAAFALLRAARATPGASTVPLQRELIAHAARTLDFVLEEMVTADGRLFHLWEAGRLSVPALPQDLFWVLAAAGALEEAHPAWKPPARLALVEGAARRWLEANLTAKSAGAGLDNELAGLIAWTAGQGRVARFPAWARERALRQLVLEPETAPDELVLGLMAFEQALGIEAWPAAAAGR
jgi:thiol-disulfide isomerase/thioredoxin